MKFPLGGLSRSAFLARRWLTKADAASAASAAAAPIAYGWVLTWVHAFDAEEGGRRSLARRALERREVILLIPVGVHENREDPGMLRRNM